VLWFRVGNVQFDKLPDCGVPRIGVVSVGLVDRTTLPLPVEVVTPVPPLSTGKVPVTLPVRETFVQLAKLPEDGVPKAPLNNTGAPAPPVLSPKAVAMPLPSPDTPVEIGRVVQFDNVPEAGVPKAGVTNVGLVARTFAPEPVSPVAVEYH
jgi:hypothetical protein